MQTRSRAKVQSLGSPVSPLENSGTPPPSSASDEEGDLGLAIMLGDGAVSDVGGDSTGVSATSELGNTTIVAAQAPASEANVATSLEHVEIDGASSLSLTVSSTRLPATCTQVPIGSLLSSGYYSLFWRRERTNVSLRASSPLRRCNGAADPYKYYVLVHLCNIFGIKDKRVKC